MAPRVEIVDINRNFALRRAIQTFSIINYGFKEIIPFLDNALVYIQFRIEDILDTYDEVKVWVCFVCDFEETYVCDDGNPKCMKQTFYFNSKSVVLQYNSDFNDFYKAAIMDFVEAKAAYIVQQKNESNISLCEIFKMDVHVNKNE